MLKLIASDLDGTLLQNGAQSLTDEAVRLIRALQDKGVIFTAASGRQYPNLYRLFGELSENMAFICENGAYVVYKGQEIASTPMSRELGIEIMKDIYSMDGCEILLSGKNTSYLQPKTEAYLHRMKNIVKNNVTLVEDITRVEEPFLKISVCRLEGIDEVAEHFHTTFGHRAKATVSGFAWLDFTAKDVNKGTALTALQQKLKLTPKETMVFGDNYNDLDMFSCAGTSYVMSAAVPEVKVYAHAEAATVEEVLARLLCEWE
ncbi:MAG: HAD family phosphatase, partial [Lachnospiraceae bacterium]|nr:HAD family phosphatase [Lachnospiraceae bacterium]